MTELQKTYERQYGRPIRDILIGALREALTVRQAAWDLGISHQTLYRWSHVHSIDIPGEILKAKMERAA